MMGISLISMLILLVMMPAHCEYVDEMCDDTMYTEECNTFLLGSGGINIEPVCVNGTISWFNCKNSLAVHMTREKSFQMCFYLNKFPYHIIDTTNGHWIQKSVPKKDSPICVMSKPGRDGNACLDLKIKPGYGPKFIVNIPFSVDKVQNPVSKAPQP